MREHRQAIAARMGHCDNAAQALFCLACSDRLVHCCWAFQKVVDHDLAPFFLWTGALFRAAEQRAWDSRSLDTAFKELDAVVPNSDEYGQPLAVQAQSGVLCLMSAIDAFRGTTSAVVEASNHIVDALDNYTYFTRKQTTGQAAAPTEYALLDRELAQQLKDVSFLESLSRARITEWRVNNRQFVIPPAV